MFPLPHWLLLQGADFSLFSEYESTKFCHDVTETFALDLEESNIFHKRTGQADQDLQMQEKKVKLQNTCTYFLKAEH